MAIGVVRIAVNLDGATVNRGDQEGSRDAVQIDGRRIANQISGHPVFGSKYIGGNFLDLETASSGAAQGQRRTHQLQPAAARQAVGEIRGDLRIIPLQRDVQIADLRIRLHRRPLQHLAIALLRGIGGYR